MNRSTTYSAFAAAVAVGAFVVAMTFSIISGALPPGGGTGNPIITGEFTFSLDSEDTQPITGDIASGQPFYVHINDIIDWDGIGDPDPGYDTIVTVKWYRQTCLLNEQFPPDDPEDPEVNWTWVCTVQPTLPHEGDPQYPNGNNAYRGTYHETDAEVLNGSCKVRYRVLIHDGATITDDDYVYATSAEKKVLDVDYVIVVPNPASVAVGGQVGLTGKAYNMGGDDERHFDDSGNVIGGTADNDVQIGATFVWCAWGPNLGAVSPLAGASTTFTAGTTAGECFVRATFDGPGVDDVYGDAQVVVTSPVGYWIDLEGINYDDVQNVPINAWAPAARDGTGDVGQIKAKVVITGEPDTEYDVTISASSDLRLNGAVGDLDLSLTTDGQGAAEQEFEIHAEPLNPTPSQTLEDHTLSASVFPSGESTACAMTTEQITLYQFSFQDPPEITATAGGTSSGGGARYDEDAFQCWTGSGAAAATCHSHMWKVAELRVLCEPTGAFGGSVTAVAEVEFHKWCYAKLGKARAEVIGGDSSLTVSFGIVTVSWTATGSNNRAGVGMDQSVQFETGPLREAGEWPHDTSEFTVSPLYDYDDKEWDHDDAMIEFDLPRSYQVGGSGHDVTLGICIVAKTTHPYVSPPPSAYGAEVLDSSYIDSEERSPDGIHVYEHDSVFEIE